ncbi:MAG: alkaline phosphatase family protein [Opitutales bacterium]
MKAFTFLIRSFGLLPLLVTLAWAQPAPRILPGLQPDGATLLHNQWPIQPAGAQVMVGDFPVAVVVDPSGKFAAVLHAGAGPHEIRIVDLATKRVVATAPLHESFQGLKFSADGKTLLCSGGSDEVLHQFAFADGQLQPLPDLPVAPADDPGVVAGFDLAPDGVKIAVARLFANAVTCVDRQTGAIVWTAQLQGKPEPKAPKARKGAVAPNDVRPEPKLDEGDQPLHVIWDGARGRVYVSLWGQSAVAVLDAADGRLLARWPVGLHPNELLLAPDGRLFVANGGRNSITVLSVADGRALETLSSAMRADDPPGSTPDSLALTPDGRTLYVANAYNDNLAVFDVSEPGSGRALGFIPTGWFPTGVNLTPDGRQLVVLNARGLEPRANSLGNAQNFSLITVLYRGVLGIIDLPHGVAYAPVLAGWTRTAQRCRPAAVVAPKAGNPIPPEAGGPSPIRYVIYVIKENRTYDQVFGDMPEGNGDPRLCLFPESNTPNLHALARQFVLLDNFYANAEVSASGHEWSMGAYASEFVEKTWPVTYGHDTKKLPYTAEGRYAAAVPSLGYLWDRAAAAGVTYRSYGEFATLGTKPGAPATTNLPALRDHLDAGYRPWDVKYHDIDRVAHFVSELHRFEAAGDMPRLQILRLPQDHTVGAKVGERTPRAMVADNDLAVGQLVEALSHSRFWPQAAIFIVEDDAQSGPDHVDAHRTEALVISPYTRRGVVDSTPYTTCSMLRTMELILGLEPMSQFDALAQPMFASFQPEPGLIPYEARPAQFDLDERNVKKTVAAKLSARFDLTREDAIDDRVFNQVIWATVRGEGSRMPAPVRAAFVRTLPAADGDSDD